MGGVVALSIPDDTSSLTWRDLDDAVSFRPDTEGCLQFRVLIMIVLPLVSACTTFSDSFVIICYVSSCRLFSLIQIINPYFPEVSLDFGFLFVIVL